MFPSQRVLTLSPCSDSEVRAHLRKVFAALTVTTGFAALGCVFYMYVGRFRIELPISPRFGSYTHLPVLVSFLITLGLVLYLSAAPELSTGNTPSISRIAALLGTRDRV